MPRGKASADRTGHPPGRLALLHTCHRGLVPFCVFSWRVQAALPEQEGSVHRAGRMPWGGKGSRAAGTLDLRPGALAADRGIGMSFGKDKGGKLRISGEGGAERQRERGGGARLGGKAGTKSQPSVLAEEAKRRIGPETRRASSRGGACSGRAVEAGQRLGQAWARLDLGEGLG